MTESLAEYGLAGVAICVLASVVYKFVLLRWSTEHDTLRKEVQDIRQKYDVLLIEQQQDYRQVAQEFAEASSKSRKAIALATDMMETLAERLDNGEPRD